jgi:hypothetical protein
VRWRDFVSGRLFTYGFSGKVQIQKLIAKHEAEFLEAWHGHLGADG